MEKYLWEVHFQADTFVGVQSVKIASGEQSLTSINKALKNALKETGFDDCDCIEIIKVEYLDEVYV